MLLTNKSTRPEIIRALAGAWASMLSRPVAIKEREKGVKSRSL